MSVEQQRFEAHTASLHATHQETRRLQDDLMRKREAFVQGRDALQGALGSFLGHEVRVEVRIDEGNGSMTPTQQREAEREQRQRETPSP